MFLFDEPLSNLDAELRVHMRLELARLHARLGSTMIYVTHDQVEAMTLADKIVVLNAGKIEQVGPPLQVFDDPDNLFVAGFIGSPKMNFLPAMVVSSEERSFHLERDEGARLALPWLRAQVQTGEAVTLGIRPQHLRIDGDGLLRLQPDVVEQLGDVSYLHGVSPGGVEVVAQLAERLPAAPKNELRLAFDPTMVFVFNGDGQRIR